MSIAAIRSDVPHLVTALPGPRAQALIARDEAVLSPSYTRPYPLVADHAEGAMVDGCGRQPVSRLQRRYRRGCDGPLPPACRQVHSRAGRQAPAHVGHRLLLRKHGGLAEKLASLVPGSVPRRVYFGNSGRRPSRPPSKWPATTPDGSNSSRSSAPSMAEPWDRCR